MVILRNGGGACFVILRKGRRYNFRHFTKGTSVRIASFFETNGRHCFPSFGVLTETGGRRRTELFSFSETNVLTFKGFAVIVDVWIVCLKYSYCLMPWGTQNASCAGNRSHVCLMRATVAMLVSCGRPELCVSHAGDRGCVLLMRATGAILVSYGRAGLCGISKDKHEMCGLRAASRTMRRGM